MSNARVNLAPEVYQASQRAQQKRQSATALGTLIGFISIGIVVACLVVIGGQKVFIVTQNGQIKDKQGQIDQLADLKDAATLAQHLDSLKMLSTQKVYITRFFDVLQATTPQGLAVTSISINDTNTLEVSATAKSFGLATKFAKALEASNREIGSSASLSNPAFFNDVQLSSVSQSGSGGVDFKLTTQMSQEVTGGK
jgi:Tfp pilus assembly protein PilN